MKIAFIIPSLAQKGPILVVKDIISQILNKVDVVDVYYFNDIVEVELDCPVFKIDFSTQIEFDKYDIIHSHMYRPDKYIWKNRRKIKGKVISTMHCDPRSDFRYTYNILVSLIFRWIWLLYISKHDRVVVLTKYILETYFKQYISINKLSYIYNGISEPESSDIIDENDKILITKIKKENYKIIGTNALLTKRKGLHFIVSALPFLSDYAFIVIGNGKEKKNLQRLAKKLNVDDRCYFLGFKKNATAYLAYYDVYAMPSISEGFSLALVEATMKKRSCVCSDIKIFRETFTQDEVTFFSLGNRQSLIAAIKEAYEKKNSKGENAYKRSTSNYTSKIMGDNYFQLYKTIGGGGGGGYI
jgi:glycosyltransferase involved in cell wall biosynthesis